jgi:hypothetical protein
VAETSPAKPSAAAAFSTRISTRTSTISRRLRKTRLPPGAILGITACSLVALFLGAVVWSSSQDDNSTAFHFPEGDEDAAAVAAVTVTQTDAATPTTTPPPEPSQSAPSPTDEPGALLEPPLDGPLDPIIEELPTIEEPPAATPADDGDEGNGDNGNRGRGGGNNNGRGNDDDG